MADTLREYLLSLGWKIDEASYRKFISAVSHTAAETAKVGSVAIESAVAIEAMVARVARQYENLYYVSVRSQQSVGYIQQTQFAFKQIGLTADDANASIEGIASQLRRQPWLSAIFGGAKTPQQIATNLGRSGLPYFLQTQFAEMIGMDEKTLFHLQQFAAVSDKAQRDFAKRQSEAGIDPDKLALKFTRFSRVLNTLESDFDILGDRIAMDWVDPAEAGIKTLDDITQWFNKADHATSGFIGTLATLATTLLGGLAGTKLLGKFLGFDVAALKIGGRGLKVGAWGVGLGALEAMKGDKDHSLRSQLRALFGIEETDADRNAPAPWEHGGTGPASSPSGGGNATDRLNQAIAFFEKNGFDRDAAIGIASALFMESGKTLSPTAFNPAGGGAGARGIGQWRGDRAAAFEKMFGKPLEKASFEEQLQYVLWEMTQGKDAGALSAGGLLRKGGLSAGQSSTAFLNLFERPGPGGAREVSDTSSFADALSRLAAQQNVGGDTTNHVTLHQRTDIHVTGGAASDVADRVTDAQDRVSQGTIRALQGAMR